MSEGLSTVLVSSRRTVGGGEFLVAHFIDIVRVYSIASLLDGFLYSSFHDLLDVLLALFAVDVDVPLVPVAQPILKCVGSLAHPFVVDRNAWSTVTFRFERQLVTPVL